jgi:hypothetical protein
VLARLQLSSCSIVRTGKVIIAGKSTIMRAAPEGRRLRSLFGVQERLAPTAILNGGEGKIESWPLGDPDLKKRSAGRAGHDAKRVCARACVALFGAVGLIHPSTVSLQLYVQLYPCSCTRFLQETYDDNDPSLIAGKMNGCVNAFDVFLLLLLHHLFAARSKCLVLHAREWDTYLRFV